jgi:hypothetical protein
VFFRVGGGHFSLWPQQPAQDLASSKHSTGPIWTLRARSCYCQAGVRLSSQRLGIGRYSDTAQGHEVYAQASLRSRDGWSCRSHRLTERPTPPIPPYGDRKRCWALIPTAGTYTDSGILALVSTRRSVTPRLKMVPSGREWKLRHGQASASPVARSQTISSPRRTLWSY